MRNTINFTFVPCQLTPNDDLLLDFNSMEISPYDDDDDDDDDEDIENDDDYDDANDDVDYKYQWSDATLVNFAYSVHSMA